MAEVDEAGPEEPERLRRLFIEIAGSLVVEHGAELVDVEVSGTGSYMVRLLLHRHAGVTVDLCEAVSRELSDVLDVGDPIPGRYRLEVTSPGLDRPLHTDGDFRRAHDRRLKVVTADGRTEYGRLLGFTDAVIQLGDGPTRDELSVDRGTIVRATIEAEF